LSNKRLHLKELRLLDSDLHYREIQDNRPSWLLDRL
jgi:hypothetical protein